MNMVRVDHVDYEDVSEGVRRFCAERLHELERSLRPLVDGSFGEVVPGHLAGYLATIRALGKLYQVEKPPRSLQDMVPAAKVREILAGMEARHQAALEGAVAAAEERVRRELSQGSAVSVAQAQETVLTRLLELESRLPAAS